MNENVQQPNLLARILKFPLIKIIIGIVLINVPTFIMRSIAQAILSALSIHHVTVTALVVFSIRLLTVYFFYTLFVKLFEKRKASELSLDGSSLKEFFHGGLIALISILVVMGIIWLTGAFRIQGINASATLFRSILYHFFFAFLQDVVYFLIIFRIVEKNLGSWPAIITSSFIFGFKHLLFPGYTLWSVVAQTLEAGILFSALFIMTHRIWMIFGFHFIWNFIEYGLILGFQSEQLVGLFQSDFSGSNLITGMPVGLEASIVTCILLTGLGIYFVYKTYKQGRFILPVRKKTDDASPM
jgi:membrane protease YdiL (CAAX protease family)